jgi:hypothetical protein
LRAKLRLLEGSRVKFLLLKDMLIIIPENGQKVELKGEKK